MQKTRKRGLLVSRKLEKSRGQRRKKVVGRHGRNGNKKLPVMISERGKTKEKNDDKGMALKIYSTITRREPRQQKQP
jgi:hypothetical protein